MENFYRFPWEKKLNEEIFKGISLENWSWGKNFKRDFFYNWDRNRVLSDPRYRPPTPVLVKWSEKSESIFGPLNLLIFGYVKGGVLGNNNIGGKKCSTTFLWVLNLGQVGGRWKFFQNLTTGMIFLKMVSNLSVLEGIFETKFQGRFFSKNFLKGFLL